MKSSRFISKRFSGRSSSDGPPGGFSPRVPVDGGCRPADDGGGGPRGSEDVDCSDGKDRDVQTVLPSARTRVCPVYTADQPVQRIRDGRSESLGHQDGTPSLPYDGSTTGTQSLGEEVSVSGGIAGTVTRTSMPIQPVRSHAWVNFITDVQKRKLPSITTRTMASHTGKPNCTRSLENHETGPVYAVEGECRPPISRITGSRNASGNAPRVKIEKEERERQLLDSNLPAMYLRTNRVRVARSLILGGGDRRNIRKSAISRKATI